MIYHFILNPKSGRRGKLQNLEDEIKEACRKRKLSYHIYYTVATGDATAYVRSMVRISGERQRFLCIGGDGTINEIVNSAPCNENVEFGVIPNGSGNDFVRNFSNKENLFDIDAQIDGETVSLDLIRVNDTYCVNMVNIGFDCAVVREADRLKNKKLVTPGFSYIAGVAVVLCRKFGTKMKLLYDDGTVVDSVLTLTAIGNGRFCGGGFMACPKAKLQDGKMDICAIKKVTRRKFITLVSSYKAGTYLENKRAMEVINYRQESHFRMEFEEPVPICVDGEISGAKNVEFTVVPNAFRFVVPKGSELLS